MTRALALLIVGAAIAVAGVVAPGPGGLYVAGGVVVIVLAVDLLELELQRRRLERRRAARRGYVNRR